MENLILQGGALAVILFAFLAVLTWLLKHFTTALNRIETAIHANSLAVVHLNKLMVQTQLKPDDDQKQQVFKDTIRSMDQVDASLRELIQERRK